MVKDMGRAVLLGDVEAPYHPVQAVEQDINAILAPSFSVETIVEYGAALEGQPSLNADVIISYTDRWTEKLTEEQADGLLAYVSKGGGLVSLHCGISLAIHERLLPLFGAKFTGHPPFQPLKFTPVVEASKAEGGIASEDADRFAALLAAIEPFELDEEPYRYEFADAPNGDREVLLQYEHEGASYPAVWIQTYGQGRIINVMPGHTADSLRHPAVRRLLLAATAWAARS
ncbi:hypothetical protein PCCS19_35810 [Paenibacillus sp. CCS19]|uniref:ThuA domain-containing protein n=1 Tax=Paenibacillus sp. CCS19 TaxID=3158387 RepID=UPI0025687900|nr:ThuA domain-containing protein [Paenibacillus cellulosilyticus]GMK40525.1 hypothetical protein PCCS19_35810 [Paenibacillus cellulosilyticus]